MNNIKDYVLGFLAIALFIVAFLSFGIEMGNEHSAGVNLENDSRVSVLYSGVNSTIYDYEDGETLQEEANSTLSGFNAEDPSGTGSDGIFFSTVTAVGKSIMGVAFGVFDSIWNPILKVIIPSREIRTVISVVLSTMLLFISILLAWKLYRVGY